MIKRIIELPVNKHSFFLFGPRQTGKTTLIKSYLENNNAVYINLLHYDELIKYKANPSLLRDEVDFFISKKKKGIIFIDEIQKLPELLDEIHDLMEQNKDKLQFILTGSSARKLKRVSTNLLGGRAWSYFLFPFTHIELGSHFKLYDVLRFGSLPPLLGLDQSDKIKTLDAYAKIYLKEEIMDEAIVRNLGAFSRFLDLAADNSGELISYTNIARETAILSKTIKEYYQILEDTLIAIRLEPYVKSIRKRLIQHPKFYFFDIGVMNSLCGRLTMNIKKNTQLFGKLFEHFVILELYRLIHYKEKPWKLYFWRTSHGAEVDLIIEFSQKKLYGIEIKSAEYVDSKELTGLKQFLLDYPQARGFCICNTKKPYLKNNISFLPWEHFFSDELGLQ